MALFPRVFQFLFTLQPGSLAICIPKPIVFTYAFAVPPKQQSHTAWAKRKQTTKNVCQMRPQQKIETYHHHHLYKFAIYDHYYTYIIIIVCHSLWLLPNIYI